MGWARNTSLHPKAGIHGRCLVCGKPIHNPMHAKQVWVHGHGEWIITNKDDAEALGGQDANQGMKFIGPECAKRLRRVLGPYMERG